MPGCKVIVRSRFSETLWEKLCKSVVGDPVHMDIVLSKPGTSTACFCFSAYMRERFQMTLMDEALLLDESMMNHSLDVTEEEFTKCLNFLHKMVEARTRYDYLDALLYMPASQILHAKISGDDVKSETEIQKVFCSQSVVLMLRSGLDCEGLHKDLVHSLQAMNSRLSSPREVHNLLLQHPANSVMSNHELLCLADAARGRSTLCEV
jgi:hypothetical protein